LPPVRRQHFEIIRVYIRNERNKTKYKFIGEVKGIVSGQEAIAEINTFLGPHFQNNNLQVGTTACGGKQSLTTSLQYVCVSNFLNTILVATIES
jgi:hypothetical protein